MKNRKTLRLIAGACFAISAVLTIVSSAQTLSYGFDFSTFLITLLPVIMDGLIAVSMFTSTPILTTVGSAGQLVFSSLALISLIAVRECFAGNIGHILMYNILGIFIWLSLIIAGINTKSAKRMGIIAGVIAAVSFVANIIGNLTIFGSMRISFIGFLSSLVTIVGVLLVGLSLEGLATRKVAAVASGGKAKIQQGSDNTIERLTRLKALLDKGIITQEEFETKKKQILGM